MTLSDRIIAAEPGEAREVMEELWDASPHAWKPKCAYREFAEMIEMGGPAACGAAIHRGGTAQPGNLKGDNT